MLRKEGVKQTIACAGKKGLSDVITTVLIIVMALVAISIVGGIVIRQVQKSGERMEAMSACRENGVVVDQCTLSPSEPNKATVVLRREGSATTYQISEVRTIIEYTDTSREAVLLGRPIEPFETRAIGFTKYKDIKQVSAVGSMKIGASDYPCAASSTVICSPPTLLPTTEWYDDLLAITLNGNNDNVEVVDTGGVFSNSAQSFSISFWINATEFPSEGSVKAIMHNKIDMSSRGFKIYISSDYKLYFVTDTATEGGQIPTTTTLLKDTWYNIVITYNATSTLSIYCNSNNEGSATNNINPIYTPNINPLIIGDNFNGWSSSDNFKGSLDNIRIYPRALTLAEVQTLYDSGNGRNKRFDFGAGSNANTAFTFDEFRWGTEGGSGYVINDTSSNSHKGELNR